MPLTDADRHAYYWRTVIRDALRACPASHAAGLSISSIESLAIHAAVRVAAELQATAGSEQAALATLAAMQVPPPRTPEPA